MELDEQVNGGDKSNLEDDLFQDQQDELRRHMDVSVISNKTIF